MTSCMRWVISPCVMASTMPNRITTLLIFNEIVSALQAGVVFLGGHRAPEDDLVSSQALEGGGTAAIARPMDRMFARVAFRTGSLKAGSNLSTATCVLFYQFVAQLFSSLVEHKRTRSSSRAAIVPRMYRPPLASEVPWLVKPPLPNRLSTRVGGPYRETTHNSNCSTRFHGSIYRN